MVSRLTAADLMHASLRRHVTGTEPSGWLLTQGEHPDEESAALRHHKVRTQKVIQQALLENEIDAPPGLYGDVLHAVYT